MATLTDARASAFDADVFRDAIRFAMSMGLPDTESERITFRWTPQKSYSIADPAGNPYSWDQTPSEVVEHDDVQVPAAVEFTSRASGGVVGSPFGEIDSPRIVVTLLDEDYEQVRGADLVILNDSVYVVNFVKPPDGLFDVTIYTLYCTARDEN